MIKVRTIDFFYRLGWIVLFKCFVSQWLFREASRLFCFWTIFYYYLLFFPLFKGLTDVRTPPEVVKQTQIVPEVVKKISYYSEASNRNKSDTRSMSPASRVYKERYGRADRLRTRSRSKIRDRRRSMSRNDQQRIPYCSESSNRRNVSPVNKRTHHSSNKLWLRSRSKSGRRERSHRKKSVTRNLSPVSKRSHRNSNKRSRSKSERREPSGSKSYSRSDSRSHRRKRLRSRSKLESRERKRSTSADSESNNRRKNKRLRSKSKSKSKRSDRKKKRSRSLSPTTKSSKRDDSRSDRLKNKRLRSRSKSQSQELSIKKERESEVWIVAVKTTNVWKSINQKALRDVAERRAHSTSFRLIYTL